MKKLLTILVSTLFLSSCYKDKEEILYPSKDCSIQQNVSYKKDLVPILETRCYTCHNAANAKVKGANIILDSYTKLSEAIDNNSLISSIKQDGNASAMPKNSNKLTECQISGFETWVFEGKKDN